MVDLQEKPLLRGLAAGLVATAAYTAVSALLHSRATAVDGVDGDDADATRDRPCGVTAELVGAVQGGENTRRALDTAVHWGYGAACGTVRTVLERRGVYGWRADAAHLAVVWLPWRVALVLRDLKRGSGPPRPRTLAHEALKHGVYVVVAGRAHTLLGASGRRGDVEGRPHVSRPGSRSWR